MHRCVSLMVFLFMMVCCLTTVSAETVVGDPASRMNAGQIEYEGTNYRPKRRLTTVLLIGTDTTNETEVNASFRDGGQADFLLLLVFDENEKTIRPVQINRDTMTEIRAFSEFGQETGLWKAQICLAHSFGDGKEQSCKLTVDAVSRYLKDIQIDGYVAMNLDGISAFNDALGGITVTLEEDFSAYDSTMLQGTTITLHGKQAEYYTRMRYNIGDQTNASRMLRQETYIKQAAIRFKEKIEATPSFAEAVYWELNPYIVTDMTQGRMINLASLASHYQVFEMLEIDGTGSLGDSGYIEFYPDDKAVWETVLSLFYDEMDE